MSFANDLLIGNPLRGNGWKKVFALTLVWMATALLASAQTLTTLHSFTLGDGALPQFATPTQGRDGNAYATTSVGGLSTTCGLGCGTTFKITSQGALTSFSFDGTDGAISDAGLVLGRDGLFYGTTSSAGASGNGDVFRLNPQTGALTVLHSFAGSDGASPEAPLTLGPGGKYYGTTYTGGANNLGTVFSITASGTFKSLHSFGGAGLGQNPSAGLTLGSDGVLYGMTYGGGHQRFRNDLQDHRLRHHHETFRRCTFAGKPSSGRRWQYVRYDRRRRRSRPGDRVQAHPCRRRNRLAQLRCYRRG